MVAVELVVFGLFLAFLGFGAAWNAYEVARKDEQYDAVGSRRSFLDVEPAGWKVSLVRLFWGGVGVVGVAAVVAGFLR